MVGGIRLFVTGVACLAVMVQAAGCLGKGKTSHRGEFRAVWCNATGGGLERGWQQTAQVLAENGFNGVIPNMSSAGSASYKSDLLPHASVVEKKGDQLRQCVEAAHKHGIEVHAWKVNWVLSGAPKSRRAAFRKEGRLQKSLTGKEVAWLCPSDPRNQKLELDAMLEVVRKYDVSGVHFDYIRYPNRKSCYCDHCRARFEKAIGRKVENWPQDAFQGPLKDAWTDWRCEQITRLVRKVSEEAHKLKPRIKVSAAVIKDFPACRESVGQDWVAWVRAGYLDFVCPMDYTNSDEDFRQLVASQVAHVNGHIPLYPGIGVSSSKSKLSPERVIGQIKITRECRADGFVIFSLRPPVAEKVLPACRVSATAEPAVPPHHD